VFHEQAERIFWLPCLFFGASIKYVPSAHFLCARHGYRHFMTQRHPLQSGKIMLITTVTKNREPIFQDPACARTAVETLYVVQNFYPVFLFGFVVMPDHMHLLVHVPSGGTISKFMQSYKRAASFNIGRPLWQKRFHIRCADNPPGALLYIVQIRCEQTFA
jgi:REP element-mobilizing transposase RayT